MIGEEEGGGVHVQRIMRCAAALRRRGSRRCAFVARHPLLLLDRHQTSMLFNTPPYGCYEVTFCNRSKSEVFAFVTNNF